MYDSLFYILKEKIDVTNLSNFLDDMGVELSKEEQSDLINHLPVSGEHINYFNAFQIWLSELIIRNADIEQLHLCVSFII